MTTSARPTMLRKLQVPLALSLAFIGTSALACNSDIAASAGPERLLGRWEAVAQTLPPVTLEVRRDSGALVGQVWLSGVTVTLPAAIDDTSVVLARPESSAPAPYVGVLLSNGLLRLTIRGQPDVVKDLRRVK